MAKSYRFINGQIEFIGENSQSNDSIAFPGKVITQYSPDGDNSLEATTATISSATITAISAPTGRTATYVIAASDYTGPAQADYVCDGTADNVEIQTAITALYNGIGGKIFLTAGTFNISQAIVLPRCPQQYRIEINGEARHTTMLFVVNDANCNVFEYVGGAGSDTPRYYFKDFSINGNYTHQTSGNGFYITSALSDVLLDHVGISNCKETGFNALGVTMPSLRLRDCVMEYNQNCGVKTSGSNVDIHGGMYSYNKESGIRLAGALSISRVSDVAAYQNGQNGIYLNGDRTSITGCTIYQNSYGNTNTYDGIATSGFNRCVITNNVIDGFDSQRYGIYGGTTDYNNIISNNNLTRNVTGNISPLLYKSTSIINNNQGYIAPGEIRTYSGTITGSTANNGAVMLSVANPWGQAVRALEGNISITAQSSTASTLDMGIGTSATTDYATMIAALPLNPGTSYPYFYTSTNTTNYGVRPLPINWPSTSYLNFFNPSANATGTTCAISYVVTVMGN